MIRQERLTVKFEELEFRWWHCSHPIVKLLCQLMVLPEQEVAAFTPYTTSRDTFIEVISSNVTVMLVIPVKIFIGDSMSFSLCHQLNSFAQVKFLDAILDTNDSYCCHNHFHPRKHLSFGRMPWTFSLWLSIGLCTCRWLSPQLCKM